MAAVGKWGGRIGYVGNLLGCPYIQCNPLLSIARNKAWSVPRLLRHSGSGLGGIRGYGGRNALPHGKRQRGAAHCAIMGSCIFFLFQHWGMAGPLVASLPQCYQFWCKAIRGHLRFPSPLVTRGQIFKKPLNQRLIFFPCLFSDIELISF